MPTMVSSKVRLLAVGISLEFKKRMEELLCCFLKVQVSLLLGAAGKAEIKNRE